MPNSLSEFLSLLPMSVLLFCLLLKAVGPLFNPSKGALGSQGRTETQLHTCTKTWLQHPYIDIYS